MEISVEPSKTYAVTTSGSCTVTDADGLELCTASSGSQAFFVATTPTVTISDDGAKVSRATFNYALAALGLLGGGDKLPAGYTRVDFLESTGTQYINTGIRLQDGYTLSTEFEPVAVLQNTAVFGARLANPNRVDFTRKGYESIYRISCRQNGTFAEVPFGIETGTRYKIELNDSAQTFKLNGAITTGLNFAAPSAIDLYIFCQNFPTGGNAANGDRAIYFDLIKMWKFALQNGDGKRYALVPALTPAGEPCMYDLVTRKPYPNVGTGQFVVGMTLSQVRGLRLPAGWGELTLALPHEASIDRLAQAALERARANGWELTLQYAEAEVPAGYRRLDFLESTGTQWFDTEFTPKMGDELSIEVSFKNNVAGAPSTLFSAGNDTFQLAGVALYQAQYHPAGFTSFHIRYFSDYAQNFDLPTNTKAKIKINNTGECFLNEKVLFINQPKGEVNTSLLLCKRVALTSVNYFTGRIYSFTISRSGEMQVDYVPCIAPDGTLGMYNKVDGTVKENAGTGQFIAGLATVDDVRKLWLPETGGELTVSVPADTPDSAITQLRANNPTWQIAIQYRTDNEN